MKIDYNKKEFSDEEKDHLLKESEVLTEKYPDRIPILIQVDSNILKIEKHKYLVANDVTVEFYFQVLERKLLDLSLSDTLVISVAKFEKNGTQVLTTVKFDTHKPLKDFFEQYKDPSTGMLILVVSRSTSYKWAKSTLKYYLGY